jgi:hypothetical protein
MVLERWTIPNFRSVALGTGYNPADGNRRASRNGRVGSSPQCFRFAPFSHAAPQANGVLIAGEPRALDTTLGLPHPTVHATLCAELWDEATTSPDKTARKVRWEGALWPERKLSTSLRARDPLRDPAEADAVL